MNSFKKLINNNFFWLLVFLFYLSIINLFIIHSTPEVIAIQFAIVIFLFNKRRFNSFKKDWVPFIGLFFLYELIRGFVDDLSPFYSHTLTWAYNFELSIFKKLPTIYLQEILSENIYILNISLLFYTSFFYYSFLIGFLIWLKNKKLFLEYKNKFLLLSYTGMIFFFLIPTAPPWLISQEIKLGIEKLIYHKTVINSIPNSTIFYYFVYGNPVAAFPSLHTAWPAFTSLFLIRNLKKKICYLTLIVPLMISFSVIYTGEHFVIDVIAGWLFAIVAVGFSKTRAKTTQKPGQQRQSHQ